MKVIRIVFGLIGAAYLIGVMVFGLGTTWLMNDPKAATGVALGVASVDGDAGVIENARSFAGGYAAGGELVEMSERLEADSSLRSKCEGQQDSDWGLPPECAELDRADDARYRELKDGW